MWAEKKVCCTILNQCYAEPSPAMLPVDGNILLIAQVVLQPDRVGTILSKSKQNKVTLGHFEAKL